tara:strand:- start:4463 stop:5485 length:1023 start_codon:yes stop_codon:yes gene_type:complete
MNRHTIPVTLLTGFLGSGKTTLINRILREAHGRRFAVIENEYGETNVDADLLLNDGDETVVQLTNGCVCCTVRGDLANALHSLAVQRERGEIAFDQVLIEPTGLADPGPIVRTFMAETELLSRFHLDGVVTLFDAVNGRRNLLESVEAQAQLGYADRVLLTKVDLLDDQPDGRSENEIRAGISAANAAAEIESIDLNTAPWGEMFEKLLCLRGFQFDRVVFAPVSPPSNATGTAHTPGVSSLKFEAEAPLDGVQLNKALARINEKYGESLWRIKGVLAIEGMRNRVVVQGVQGLVQANPTTVWRPYEPRHSKLVLIGRELDTQWLQEVLQSSVSQSQVLS